MPVLIDRYRLAVRTIYHYRLVPVDQYGHFCKFCYINVKKLKMLGTFRPQPCGSPRTLRMTPLAKFALLHQWAGVLTFLNTVDTRFPTLLIGRGGARGGRGPTAAGEVLLFE